MPECQFKSLGKSIGVTPESIKYETPREIRVTNRLNLEDLSNMHLQISATCLTPGNTVLATIDAALSCFGFVPSWVVDKHITSDTVIQPDAVFLDRICGTETYFQLLNPNYYLEGFTPAVYLVKNNGEVEPAVDKDLNRMKLADYSKLVVGVQFTPHEMAQEEILRRWTKRYSKLSKGSVELVPVRALNGDQVKGIFSLTGGPVEIQATDISKVEYPLKNVYSQNACVIPNFTVDGSSFITLADRKLGGRAIYRANCNDNHQTVHMATVQGLERAIAKELKTVDPRDISIYIDVMRNAGESPTDGVKALAGMKYNIIAFVHGLPTLFYSTNR